MSPAHFPVSCNVLTFFLQSLKRDIEYEQRVTVEIESWLDDRRSHLKELRKFWTEKAKNDIAAKDLEFQVRETT